MINQLINPPIINAQTKDWAEIGTQEGVTCVTSQGVATVQGIMCLLANVMSVALTVIGIAGFVMMVYGAVQWLLSGGNSQQVEKAGKSMTFAVIGLVVALSSFIIINILVRFTGIKAIQKFFIPDSEYEWISPKAPINPGPR